MEGFKSIRIQAKAQEGQSENYLCLFHNHTPSLINAIEILNHSWSASESTCIMMRSLLVSWRSVRALKVSSTWCLPIEEALRPMGAIVQRHPLSLVSLGVMDCCLTLTPPQGESERVCRNSHGNTSHHPFGTHIHFVPHQIQWLLGWGESGLPTNQQFIFNTHWLRSGDCIQIAIKFCLDFVWIVTDVYLTCFEAW